MTKEFPTIDGERAYPIWDIDVKWTYEADEPCSCGGKGCGWCRDLPEGRRHNGTGFCKMYKEEKTEEEVLKEVEEWWKNYSDERKRKNPSKPEISIKFLHYETWCLKWFYHWTFDDGRTDEEFVKSFEKFVRRME